MKLLSKNVFDIRTPAFPKSACSIGFFILILLFQMLADMRPPPNIYEYRLNKKILYLTFHVILPKYAKPKFLDHLLRTVLQYKLKLILSIGLQRQKCLLEMQTPKFQVLCIYIWLICTLHSSQILLGFQLSLSKVKKGRACWKSPAITYHCEILADFHIGPQIFNSSENRFLLNHPIKKEF